MRDVPHGEQQLTLRGLNLLDLSNRRLHGATPRVLKVLSVNSQARDVVLVRFPEDEGCQIADNESSYERDNRDQEWALVQLSSEVRSNRSAKEPDENAIGICGLRKDTQDKYRSERNSKKTGDREEQVPQVRLVGNDEIQRNGQSEGSGNDDDQARESNRRFLRGEAVIDIHDNARGNRVERRRNCLSLIHI